MSYRVEFDDVATAHSGKSRHGDAPMTTREFAESLPDIYRDILRAFPLFVPRGTPRAGVAFQSLYVGLGDKYTLAEVRVACERMAEAGVMTIEHEIFAHPTARGQELIAALVGETAEDTVPEFPPLPETAMAE
jgi:hypothetical protein